jgi:hypothetical protein
MRMHVRIAAALGLLVVCANTARAQSTSVDVDKVRHEVTVTTGPFDIPADMAMEGMDMSGMDMEHDGYPKKLFRFEWPVEGAVKSFKVELRDAHGRWLPRAILHHVIGVNLDRRMLVYPAAERLFGIGRETEALELPGLLAVPVEKGHHIGYYIAWHNETGRDLHGVKVRLILNYTTARELIPVLPMLVDVNNVIAGDNRFDLPPGRSSKAFEFTAPTSGRILGIGGHLHDYGLAVRMEDAETGAVLVQLNGTRDANGKIKSVSRKFFVVNPVRLQAGHRYRVIADYDNPTSQVVVKGAMANMAGVFAPDDARSWPALDPTDPTFRKDLESLGVRDGYVSNH